MSPTVLGRERSQHPPGPAAARCMAQPPSGKNYNIEGILAVVKLRPRERDTLARGHTVS